MTIAGKIESTIAIPDGVSELSRNFAPPSVNVAIGEGHVIVSCEYPNIREKAMVGTFHAHVRNMIHGVTEGYTYTLKIVFSHFPMKVAVKGDKVEITIETKEGTDNMILHYQVMGISKEKKWQKNLTYPKSLR